MNQPTAIPFHFTNLESMILDLPDLPQSARILSTFAFAPATLTLYNSVLKRLSEWLDHRKLSDDSLALHLCELHERGLAPNSISTVVTALRFLCKHSHIPSPIGPHTIRIHSAIRRLGCNRGRGQSPGISFQEAEKMIRTAEARTNRYTGLRDAAIFSVASDALLRVSEIITLDYEDFTVNRDGSGHLSIRKSKTDQEGLGAVQYLGNPTVTRVQKWLSYSGIESGPLFRPRAKNRQTPAKRMGARTVTDAIQNTARQAGIRERVTGHSFRVGATQDLTTMGASIAELQIAGRWKSPDMPAHYAKGQLANLSAVAKFRYQKSISHIADN